VVAPKPEPEDKVPEAVVKAEPEPEAAPPVEAVAPVTEEAPLVEAVAAPPEAKVPEREVEARVDVGPLAKAVEPGDVQQLAEMTAGIVIDRFRSAMIAALRELGGEVAVAPEARVSGQPRVAQAPAPPAPKVEEVVAPEVGVEPVSGVAVEAPPVAVRRPRPVVPPWSEDEETAVEVPKQRWTGQIREITLGATEADGGTRVQTVTVGGQTTLPFLDFEGEVGRRPAIGIEIQDKKPEDWSALVREAWGDVLDDPAEWARAAEEAGADLIVLQLSLQDASGEPNTAAKARETVKKVLEATGLPLIVLGPGQVEADNELLVAVAEEAAGERVVLGLCEEKNYRTIAAAALAHDQLVIASTAMDVNLAKQLNILVSDMGLPLDRIVMDPTCAGVGYGMEYGYSVMERLRLAALQGDTMTQLPMISIVGKEAWRQKEAKTDDGVPEAWGDWEERAINWETVTAAALVESAADILVLRHPKSLQRIKQMLDEMGDW
jgi:acetyl-CoA decarbonylase/synthase complex subunit delta